MEQFGNSKYLIPKDCIACLRECFGYSKFVRMQWKVISSIIYEQRDNLLVTATNSGKSLCYQFPSVYCNMITIVIAPLIAQMQDQVNSINSVAEIACFLGSAQPDPNMIEYVIEGRYNLVYVTPEYITSDCGEQLIAEIRDRIQLFAIDGAHSMSKCGTEYRPAFGNLAYLRHMCPEVPIIALTATATLQVRSDIYDCLGLRDPQIIITNLDRPNLKYIVQQKTDPWGDMYPYISQVQNGSIIIFCLKRNMTHEIASILRSNNYACGVYHGGLTAARRTKTLNDFMNNRIQIVISTMAFGIGLNKKDVRLVLHLGPAKHLESYYQQVGSAGRDGHPAKCVTFFDESDWEDIIHVLRYYNNSISQKAAEKIIMPMVKFVRTTGCRRHFILSHFNQTKGNQSMNPDCCDNCTRFNY